VGQEASFEQIIWLHGMISAFLLSGSEGGCAGPGMHARAIPQGRSIPTLRKLAMPVMPFSIFGAGRWIAPVARVCFYLPA
jgi:hypothetical protein